MSRGAPLLLAAAIFLGGTVPSASMSPAERCADAAPRGGVDICRAALAARPDDVTILRDLARAQIEVADFDAAARTYERVVQLRPEDPKAHEDLAGTLGFIRQYERAARGMERMLDLRPARAADYRALAIMYLFLNNPGQTADLTRRAADLGDPIAMYDLRRFHRDGFGVVQDLDAAVAWTERAAKAGHLGAMALLVDIYLEGLYGQPADEPRAVEWAERLRSAERDF